MENTPQKKLESIAELNLRPGREVLIQISDVSESVRATTVGYKNGEYLAFEPLKSQGLMLQDKAGRRATVIYMGQGKVYAFDTLLLTAIDSPFNLVFLSSPASYHIQTLRNRDRIESYMVGRMSVGNANAEVIIKDISLAGCRVWLSAPGDQNIKIGDKVTIHLGLAESEDDLSFRAKIRNIDRVNHDMSIGLEFLGVNADQAKALAQYIGTLSGAGHQARDDRAMTQSSN